MLLTEENFKVYAAKHYDNPYCFNEDEFLSDMNRTKTISRLLSWDTSEYTKLNIRLFLNNIISFYNVFEHHAATEMLELKIEDDRDIQKCNSVLYYLNLPLLGHGKYDIIMHRRITKEMNNA